MKKSATLCDNTDIRSVLRIIRNRKTLSEPTIYGGEIFFGGAKLTIETKLNSSKYSVILKVRNNITSKKYVLKLLNTPFDNDERSTDFKKELAILEKLNSRFIIKYFGQVESSIGKGLLLEYCPRGDLFTFLNSSESHLLVKEYYEKLCKHIVRGIKYLHEQDPPIIHRDIKSPNILLTKKYSIKLCDFNLSRLDIEENRRGTLEIWRTTPVWSAPEIYDGTYTKKSDIYSLGIVLWEIVFVVYNKYYALPFSGGYTNNVMRLSVTPDERPILNEIPTGWRNLFERVWHKNPSIRPECSEILLDIDKLF